MREHRIYGPPGTGKTTKLIDLIGRGARSYYGSVMVCSFTKAAAHELVDRDAPVDKSRVGTMHSFCYRAAGCPAIAETSKLLDEWNTGPGATQGWYVEGKGDLDDPMGAGPAGEKNDACFMATNALRNRLVPRSEWPRNLLDFDRAWTEWKRDNELVDFTELIEMAHESDAPAPVDARVLFVDEVQDCSALEIAVVRRWGQDCDHWVIAGDDQQAIYGFRGAHPDGFLKPDVPSGQKTVLPRSWRLRSKIKDYADAWGRTLTTYEPKAYEAHEAGGTIRQVDGWPHSVVTRALEQEQEWAEAHDRGEEDGRKPAVMVLASCGYMLRGVIKALREKGVPFWNPYRPADGKFNPMRGGCRRLAAFLQHEPSYADLWAWAEHIDTKKAGWQRGAKAGLKQVATDERTRALEVNWDLYRRITGAAAPVIEQEWLDRHLLSKQRKAYQYAFNVARARGAGALSKIARIVVGTIHSVKGGEARSCILMPDISVAAHTEASMQGHRGRDGLIRLMYVGMTRCSHHLSLAGPTNRFYVPLPAPPR